MSSTYAQNLGCHECIRSGFIYNVPSDQDSEPNSQNAKGLIASGGSYAGECCQDMTDTTNCASSIATASTLAEKWATVNPAGISLDLAVARCPTKQDICGSTKEIRLSNTESTPETVTMSGSWTPGDSCTYVFQANCGAPAFTIGGDVTDSDVELYYMEYTEMETILDGKWPSIFKADGTTNQIPGVPDYTVSKTLKLAGELPYFEWVRRIYPIEKLSIVSGNTIAERIKTKQLEVDAFD